MAAPLESGKEAIQEEYIENLYHTASLQAFLSRGLEQVRDLEAVNARYEEANRQHRDELQRLIEAALREIDPDPPVQQRGEASDSLVSQLKGEASDSSVSQLVDTRATTISVRNIPARYDQNKLLQEWPPDGSYDFLYLPHNYHTHKSVGYAFINFVSHEDAVAFIRQWNRKVLVRHGGNKKLDICWAEVQGLKGNLLHYRKSKLGRSDKYQPAAFRGRVRLDFVKLLEEVREEFGHA